MARQEEPHHQFKAEQIDGEVGISEEVVAEIEEVANFYDFEVDQ